MDYIRISREKEEVWVKYILDKMKNFELNKTYKGNCIEYFSKENDLILDCFMGSGTNQDYIDLAEKRINETQTQTKLF